MNFSSRRAHLRQSTSASHQALEAIVGQLDSHQSYVRYLKGMFVFRSAAEAAIARAWPSTWVWSPSALAPLLAADIRDLGQAVPAAGERTAKVIKDTESLLGCLYVLEGSSLGARVLVKDAAALGYDKSHGARHLEHQSASLESWRALIDTIETRAELDLAKLSAAAVTAFDEAAAAMMLKDYDVRG